MSQILTVVTTMNRLSTSVVNSSIEYSITALASTLRALRATTAVTGNDGGSSSSNAPHRHLAVREELEEMDIEAKVRSVQALVLHISKKRRTSSSSMAATTAWNFFLGGEEGTVATKTGGGVALSKEEEEEEQSKSKDTTTTNATTSEMTGEDSQIVRVDLNPSDDVVGICISQVAETLQSITRTLHDVQTELELHEARWFSSWRTPDTERHMGVLRTKIGVLDKRVDMLLKVKDV